MEEAYVVAGGGICLQGGAGVPFLGFGMVLWQAKAFFVQVTEGALGIGMTGFGGFTVEPAGRLDVFFATEAFFL